MHGGITAGLYVSLSPDLFGLGSFFLCLFGEDNFLSHDFAIVEDDKGKEKDKAALNKIKPHKKLVHISKIAIVLHY